jgi:hypothetical protein
LSYHQASLPAHNRKKSRTMSTQEEPGNPSADHENPSDSAERNSDGSDTVALVDLFDELDRAAFSRSLAQRQSYYSVRANRRS